ncbi:MAG: type I secretion system permease/ATPase [Rhizobiaceae bacterium]|nr:type I secretion system permease/ATPase [Rhizobiaceae bacterium]
MKNLDRARSHFRRVLFLLAAFSLVVNLLLLAMPLYMLQIYDRILPSRSMDTLLFLSIIAGGALVVLGLLEAVRSVLASRAGARLEADLGTDALLASMERSRNGETDVETVRHLATVRQFISSRMLFALLDFPFAPIFIAILYIIHPTLFWLTLAGAAVLFVLAIINQRLSRGASNRASENLGSAMSMAQSLARNAQTLQSMGMTQDGVRLWGRNNSQALIHQGTVDFRSAIMTGISRAFRMGLQIAILGVGALLVLNYEMTAGMIFAASIISGRALQPIDQVIGGWRHFAMTLESWRALKAALAKHSGDADEAKTLMQEPDGHITVKDALVLNPSGMGAAPILNRISFELQPGTVLGVVGPSGSGKSTLARLIVGVQKPNSGTIRIDGTEVQNWNNEQLGRNIGYLSQDVELLPGTVKENIARLSDQPDDLAVLDAARKAQVHALIQNLPQGYDTRIGPGGLGLSGGQRQRIGLARAFYGDPKIMVLDEPNANLDDDGELALRKALAATRSAGVTVIIVTQRKQVLNVVDQILRLHSGSLDYLGTREEFAQILQQRRQSLAEAQKAQSAVPKAKAMGSK